MDIITDLLINNNFESLDINELENIDGGIIFLGLIIPGMLLGKIFVGGLVTGVTVAGIYYSQKK